jgi:hypothetical protein
LPEVGFRFNLVLIFAAFKIVLHNGENPLNCAAASSTLVGSKFTSQAIQEIGAHTKIIAARTNAPWYRYLPAMERLDHPEVDPRFQNFLLPAEGLKKILGKMRTEPIDRLCSASSPGTQSVSASPPPGGEDAPSIGRPPLRSGRTLSP